MALIWRGAVALAAGVALGLLATWVTVVRAGFGGSITDGPWRTSLTAGTAESGPYQRASVAIHGLFALGSRETLYYTATTDSDGQNLSGTCVYHVSGRDPQARWWSITAYGADDYLIANPARRYSVSMNSVARSEDGGFVASVARGPAGPNWIPVGDGPFSLTLRLYNPGAEVRNNPAGADLPRILKVSCE